MGRSVGAGAVVAALSILLVAGTAQAVTVKSVQQGNLALANGADFAEAAITPVDRAKSIVLFTYRGSGTTANNVRLRGRFKSNEEKVIFRRTGTTGALNIRWTVLEFASGVSVVRNDSAVQVNATSDAVDLTSTPVNKARSFVLVSNSTTDTSTLGKAHYVMANLVSDTSLELKTYDNAIQDVDYQIVTCATDADCTVTWGTGSFDTTGATSNTHPVTVNTAKSFPLLSWMANGPGAAKDFLRATLTSTNLTVSRGLAGNKVDYVYQVVKFGDATTVQSGDTALASGASTASASLGASVSTQSAVALLSSAGSSWAGTVADAAGADTDNIGPGMATAELAASALTFTRAASDRGAAIAWSVASFQPSVDLEPVITTNPTSEVNAGAPVTFTVSVHNRGAINSLLPDFTFTVPTGTAISGASAPGGNWTCAFVIPPIKLGCSALNPIPAGGSTTVIFAGTATTTPGNLTATVALTAPIGHVDPDLSNNNTTKTILVKAHADLQALSLTENKDPVDATTNVIYTATVRNAGPNPAASPVATITLTNGTYVSATDWTCSASGATVVCTPPGDLAAGATSTFTLTVKAPVEGGSSNGISASVALSSSTPDLDATNNSVAQTTAVTAVSDLALTMAGPSAVTAGQNMTFDFGEENLGPSTATNTEVELTMPSGASYVSSSGTNWTCTSTPPKVTCVYGTSLGVATAPALKVVLKAPANATSATTTALIRSSESDRVSSNNSKSVVTTVTPSADIALTASTPASTVGAGQNLTYTLRPSNLGPSNAAGVRVSFDLPAGTSWVGSSGTDWTCAAAGSTYTCTLAGTLATVAAPDLYVTVKAPGSGSIVANFLAGSAIADPDSTNNAQRVTTTVTVSANLALALTGPAGGTAVAASDMDFAHTVTNNGPSSASGIRISIAVPTGASYASSSGFPWDCATGNPVVCTYSGGLSNGASTNLTVTLKAPAEGGPITTTSTVTAGENDPNTTDNVKSVSTTITPSADMSVTLSDSPDPAGASADFTYTVGAANAGPSTATGITVALGVPSGATYKSATGTDWSCALAGGTLTCSLGVTLAPKASAAPLSLVFKAPASPGDLNATATVASGVPDPVSNNNSASATTKVTAAADLELTASDTPDPVDAGANVTYALSVTNKGPSVASMVRVAMAIPTGASYVSGNGTGWTCASASGQVTCDLAGELGLATAAPLSVVLKAPSASGTLTAAPSVSSGVADPTPANNGVTLTTTVASLANLGVTLADSPDPAVSATNVTYAVQVSNAGPSSVAGVTVTMAVPANATFVSGTGTGWTCAQASGKVTCNLAGTLAVGNAQALSIVLKAPNEGGTLAATVEVSGAVKDPVPANDKASTTTEVTAAADLKLTLVDSPDPVVASGQITYTMKVENLGPSTATVVKAELTLPSGVQYLSSAGEGWTCSPGSGKVACTRTALAVGPAGDIAVQVKATSTPEKLAAAAALGAKENDPDLKNNAAEATTDVTAAVDLAMTMTAEPATVLSGGALTYTISAANNGPSTAHGVQVVLTLPAGASYQSFSGTGWTCTDEDGTVTCLAGTLALGPAETLVVKAAAPAIGGTVATLAKISGEEADPVSANNEVSVETTVTANADVSIALTATPDPVYAAGDITYTMKVANAGPSAASSLEVKLQLPAGVTFAASSGEGWSCTQLAPTITCGREPLVPGKAPDLVVRGIAPKVPGDVVATAEISAAALDTDNSNNSAQAKVTVKAASDLAVTVTDNPDPVLTGGTVSYLVKVTNNGPSVASGVKLAITLPTSGTLLTVTGNDWTCPASGSLINCTRDAELSAGPAPDVTVSLKMPNSVTTVSLTAAVSGNETDRFTTNNSVTETTSVRPAADLSLTMTDTPDPAVAGTIVSYGISIANAGPAEATSLVLEDVLPSGLSLGGAATGTGWTCAPVTGGQKVRCTLPKLAAGASTTVTMPIMGPANGGTIVNEATVVSNESDPTPENNRSIKETTAITASSDLEVALTATPDPVASASKLTYTVKVTNKGPSDATKATVTVTVPSGLSNPVVTPGTGWTCTTVAGGEFACWHPKLQAGPAPDIQLVGNSPSVPGKLNASATVSAEEPDPKTANNTAELSTRVTASVDLKIGLAAAPAMPAKVVAGGTITYRIQVTNQGPSESTGVKVDLALASGSSPISETGAGWTCTRGATSVRCEMPSLGLVTAQELTVTAKAPVTGGLATAIATVTGNDADAIPANNTASATVDVVTATDMSLDMEVSPNPVPRGKPLEVTVKVKNEGPSEASSVELTISWPEESSFSSVVGSGWLCVPTDAKTVGCQMLKMPVGAANPVVVTLTPNVAGKQVISASVRTRTGDPTEDNNSKSVEVTVGSAVLDNDLTAFASEPKDAVAVGGVITWTLTVHNNGSFPAKSVVVDGVTLTGAVAVADSAEPSGNPPGPFQLGDIEPETAKTFSIKGKVTDEGQTKLAIAASISADGVPTFSRSLEATATEGNPLKLELAANPTVIAAGAATTVTAKLSQGTLPEGGELKVTFAKDLHLKTPAVKVAGKAVSAKVTGNIAAIPLPEVPQAGLTIEMQVEAKAEASGEQKLSAILVRGEKNRSNKAELALALSESYDLGGCSAATGDPALLAGLATLALALLRRRRR